MRSFSQILAALTRLRNVGASRLTQPLLLLLLLVLPLMASTEAAYRRGISVVPPGSTVEGRTLGEWTAEWWKWLIAFPVDESPWPIIVAGVSIRGCPFLTPATARAMLVAETTVPATRR